MNGMDRGRQNKAFQRPEVWTACCRYIVEVLKAVLSEKNAPELPSGIAWEQIYEMAKYHCLEAMVFAGVREKLDRQEKIYTEWETRCAQNLVQCLTQDAEAEQIMKRMEDAGIDAVLLKGHILRGLYPERDFRQMVDLDILVRERDCDAAGKLLQELGYRQMQEPSEPEYHEGYRKPPYMGVEIHRSLVPKDSPYYEYCGKIWELMLPEKEQNGRFQMNVNDFYIFLLIHFAKHLSFWGSGIRSVLDVSVYLNRYRNVLDEEYLDNWLNRLDLQDFRKTAEALAEYWFGTSGKKPAEAVLDMEMKCFFSGAHGSRRQQVLYQAGKYRKGKTGILPYLFRRVFMNRAGMEVDYPCLKKYPALLPFCWLHRLGKNIVTKREMILYEIRYFLRIR